MTDASEFVFPAPAKLNLMLQIVGRRADGYHLLQTVFRFISYGDQLTFRLRADGRVVRVNPLPGVAEDADLCVRAARALQREAGVPDGVDIVLDKRLPPGGGLGGGSSDAATTLIALNRLWHIGFDRERLARIALELGADVPVFVRGNNAFAEGVGERLQPVPLPPAWYVVLVPPVAVSTARAFSDPELKRDSNPIRISAFSAEVGRNSLEPVVCRDYPEVAQHLDWLRRFGNAALTGSGACVFAAFPGAAVAEKALETLPPAMRGFVARGLDAHPLRDWNG
jgi:4-diphosphocytidyl-2-C-methyl-D-erythritol kinase